MLCEAIRPVVRQFLDDLLSEKDYQEVGTHLAACPRCGAFASSVGTLSYRLHEMGQVSLPPDMVSTIRYEMKKMKPAEAAKLPSAAGDLYPQFPQGAMTGAFGARMRPYWAALIALALVSFAATTAVFLWNSKKPLGFIPPARLSPLTGPAGVLQPERLGECHYHLSRSGREDLAQLIIDLQLAVERESDRSLVFLVPPDKWTGFKEGLESTSGVLKEFEGPTDEVPQVSQRVTVYFE